MYAHRHTHHQIPSLFLSFIHSFIVLHSVYVDRHWRNTYLVYSFGRKNIFLYCILFQSDIFDCLYSLNMSWIYFVFVHQVQYVFTDVHAIILFVNWSQTIQEINEFNYLGVKVACSGRSSREIASKINQVKNSINKRK